MRGLVVAACAVFFVPSAAATHPAFLYQRSMNLDGDAALERVKAFDNADHSNPLAKALAYDTCRGNTITYELAPPGKSMPRTQVRSSRQLGRPGFLFAIGYGSNDVLIRLARLRVQRHGECPTPVSLFDYSSMKPPFSPPRGLVLQDFFVNVGNYAQRYAGRELLLEEWYAGTPTSPVVRKRRTYYRYRVRTERYERFRTILIRA